MLNFHPLTLADRERIDRLVRAEDSRSADYNFGTMFLWNDSYRRYVADGDEYIVLFFCPGGKTPRFIWPIGSDPAAVIPQMAEYAAAKGFPLTILGLEEHHAAALEAQFPGEFEIKEGRDYEDYIYEADQLIELSGKHLHGKRNHINRFVQEHDWRFETLTPAMFPDCTELLEGWTEHSDAGAGTIDDERDAIRRAFAYYETLGLLGGALFAEEQLVGFTLGEKINSDTFQVRFEKARGDINGAYPMVNREFVKLVRERYPEIRYINREEDMGLENLRKSKESYAPAFLLRKFSAWKRP